MNKYSLAHLSDGAVLSGLKGNVGNERGSLALGLAHIGETEERRLFVAAAHPSMVSYLVHELGFPEQAAYKRLRAARTARKFPMIFTAVADGRLHLSAVVLLTAHLTPENVDQLVETATKLSKAELERMLRGRDPEQEGQLSLGSQSEVVANVEPQLSPGTVVATQNESNEGSRVSPGTPLGRQISPITGESDELSDMHCRIDREARELLQYAKALLSHAIPNGDNGEIFKRAMKVLVREVEKQKFGSTDRPGKRRSSSDPRHIPFAVKREVWLRDGGQCAFHSDEGKRCPSRELVQFHHIEEVAVGGTASVGNISLRCRTHNQYESEKTFGKAFMENKREQARESAARRRRAKGAEQVPAAHQPTREDVPMWDICANDEEVVLWLKHHKYSEEDGRWALMKAGPRQGVMPGTRQLACLYALRDRDRTATPAA